jgi:hypothetical protein
MVGHHSPFRCHSRQARAPCRRARVRARVLVGAANSSFASRPRWCTRGRSPAPRSHPCRRAFPSVGWSRAPRHRNGRFERFSRAGRPGRGRHSARPRGVRSYRRPMPRPGSSSDRQLAGTPTVRPTNTCVEACHRCVSGRSEHLSDGVGRGDTGERRVSPPPSAPVRLAA